MVHDEAARIAQTLGSEAGERWLSLLRPALRLSSDAGVEGRVVGQLGGDPRLPEGMPWPEWDGIGPLGFVASLDCASLPAGEIGLPLPSDGTLLFFYYEGDGDLFVDLSYPSTQAGARVVYLPGGTPTSRRPAPAGPRAYQEAPLRSRLILTAATRDNPVWREAFADLPPDVPVDEARHLLLDPQLPKEFAREHQVGGYPALLQGDVVRNVTSYALGDRLDRDSPLWSLEAERWVLLMQVDTDGNTGMCWGDSGVLHWLIRAEDLAAADFDRAVMTWVCM